MLRALAPAGQRARLSVMIFHRVMSAQDPLQPTEPTAQDFEAQLRWVRDWFNVLPLSEAARGLATGRLPERPLAITFDDGYADNYTIALPILQRLGLPATFFVATGYLDGGRMFNDSVIESVRQARGDTVDLTELKLGHHSIATDEERRGAIGSILERLKYLEPKPREDATVRLAQMVGAVLRTDLMMTSSQVADLHAAGMEIGAHTVSHPVLAQVDLAIAREEISRGRERLREITGAPVCVFAYPNGRPQRDYRREHVTLVRELGFDAAVSTAWGAARPGADAFQIPRFTPWDRESWRYGLRMLGNLLRSDFMRA
jgi:peptidoglycan/xylan/chitin deacetylase (PgdA/CDA1 family)